MTNQRTKLLLLILAGIITGLPLQGQYHHERWNSIDVQHYCFEIDLNDSSDIISCIAEVEILFKTTLPYFNLDLIGHSGEGHGMQIDRITESGDKVSFIHENNLIQLPGGGILKGDTRNYRIEYHGIPSDGLIISENKFGERTFFGDNWPNRARHWLPTVDHPSDKATAEFIVEAPSHYSIVSIGSHTGEVWNEKRIISHWKMNTPLSTKLMVIGVGPFEVEYQESASGIEVSSWVYPQNQQAGFSDYSVAMDPINFFENYIGPYPWPKLANVQSKTRYGGMENASCIFYHERTVNGKRNNESLFAHEIAHQWYGDAISELNWHHIWISEGFATYLTDIFMENKYGRDAFITSMLDEKRQVLEFARKRLAPVVDTTLPVSIRLLNKNTYEKAGWVLHMLRHELGDELFQCCVRTFYNDFKFDNALTGDFLQVVEHLSGRDFKAFFMQWFHIPGHPVLSAKWKHKKEQLKVTIDQHQKQYVFDFPLEVRIELNNGTFIEQTLHINKASETFTIPLATEPSGIMLDPNTWLLYETYYSSEGGSSSLPSQ